MLKSMYSGVSGMRGFQTKLDVIGNNIANVNTVGFKGSRVMFKDIMSQTTAGVTALEMLLVVSMRNKSALVYPWVQLIRCIWQVAQ